MDACLTGVGASFDGKIYEADIPEKFKKFDIAALEMLNILIATRVWAKNGKIVPVRCTVIIYL